MAALHLTAHLAQLVSTPLGAGAPLQGAVHGALVAPLVSTCRGAGAPQQEAAQGAVMALPTPTTLEAVAPATLVPGHATLDTQ